jgi:hypothetical protein
LLRTGALLVGPDEHIYEICMAMPDGKEFKSLENRCLGLKPVTKS